MSENKEIAAWIDRERKKDEEFLQWLAKTLNIGLNLARIETIKEQLTKNKKISKTDKFQLREELKKNEEILTTELSIYMSSIGDDYFHKIKRRLASRLNRQKNKNKKLSIELSQSVLKKLSELKGKHPLKNTLEVMITYVHEEQTSKPGMVMPITPPKTKPLLETIPDIKRASLGLPLAYTQAQISNQEKFESLERASVAQIKSIENLQKIIETIESKIVTKLQK